MAALSASSRPYPPLLHSVMKTTSLSPAVVHEDSPRRRISWGAVLAGALIALVLQLLMSLLGLGIGLSTINPQSEAGNPADGLGTGAAIWWVVSSLISVFAGGWVAGRLAGIPRPMDSMLHGLLAWGVVTLLTFYLITTSLGNLISGATGVVGRGLSMAGQGIAAVAPQAAGAIEGKLQEHGIDTSSLKGEMENLLRQTGKPELQPENLQNQANQAAQEAQNQTAQAAANPQAADANADSLIRNLFREGQETVAAADRDAAVNVVVARTGKPRPEAEQIVDRWISTWQTTRQKAQETAAQAKEKAKEVGEKAASGLSKASLMAFFGLVLGAAAAAFGGRSSTPAPLTADVRDA